MYCMLKCIAVCCGNVAESSEITEKKLPSIHAGRINRQPVRYATGDMDQYWTNVSGYNRFISSIDFC